MPVHCGVSLACKAQRRCLGSQGGDAGCPGAGRRHCRHPCLESMICAAAWSGLVRGQCSRSHRAHEELESTRETSVPDAEPAPMANQEGLCGRPARSWLCGAGQGQFLPSVDIPATIALSALVLPCVPGCSVCATSKISQGDGQAAIVALALRSHVCCRSCFLRAGLGRAQRGGTSRNLYPAPALQRLLVTSGTILLRRCLALWLLPSSSLGWCLENSSMDGKSCFILGLYKPAHIF